MRTGGTSKRNHDINETVNFHPENAIEMIEYLSPHVPARRGLKVLDACSGERNLGGAFGEVFKGRVYLIEYIDKSQGNDILDHYGKYDVIICNPPWSIKNSLPIFWKLIDLLAPGGVLFYVINNVFCYQGSDRAQELLYQKYYFLPRWTFKHAGRPLLDCGVMVHHSKHTMSQAAASLRPYIPLIRRY